MSEAYESELVVIVRGRLLELVRESGPLLQLLALWRNRLRVAELLRILKIPPCPSPLRLLTL